MTATTINAKASDHWSLFVRNWGDEGYCSHEEHYLDLSQITLALPPSDPSVIDPTRPGALAGSNVRSNRQDSSVTWFPVSDGSRPDVLVTFNIAQPPDHPWVAGELDVSWKRKVPLPHPQSAFSLALATPVVAPPPDEEEDTPDILLDQAFDAMTATQQADLASIVSQALPPRPASTRFQITPVAATTPPPKPTAVPTVSTGPATSRQVELFNVRLAAMCSATQGSIPGQPGACDTMPPVTILNTVGGSLSASNWIVSPLDSNPISDARDRRRELANALLCSGDLG